MGKVDEKFLRIKDMLLSKDDGIMQVGITLLQGSYPKTWEFIRHLYIIKIATNQRIMQYSQVGDYLRNSIEKFFRTYPDQTLD